MSVAALGTQPTYLRSALPGAPLQIALDPIQRLEKMSPSELQQLGANDKTGFFKALQAAAIESERKYGVPAEVTLAQAALESGWGKSPIGGYNIFGIKGEGPAGSVIKETREWDGSKYITVKAKFAKYHNFYEAVVEHGKLFHNGYYDKAVNQFAKDKDYKNFISNIQGIYATDPKYSTKLNQIIDQYHLATRRTPSQDLLGPIWDFCKNAFTRLKSWLVAIWKRLE
ncbi:MAG TPA: glucosaminidase domain-containing protein [Chroococcales cyanobacterium]